MSICLQKVEIDGHTVQLFQNEEGGHITGYSFARDKYYPDPMQQLPDDFEPIRFSKTPEEIAEEIAEIKEYPTLALPARKLRKETLERFDIKTGVSEMDGETITTIHFPSKVNGEVTGYKTKLIDPKKFWSVGEVIEADLFGWEQALASGSNKLFVVEGELDVAATYQMLKDNAAGGKWADLDPAIVTVPNGAGAAKAALAKKASEINKHFDSVVFVFDMDKAGQDAIAECVRIYPDATVASLPANDPNACLIEGRPKAFCRAVLFKSTKPKNTRLVKGSTLREAAGKKPEWGISYPWDGITQLTRGKRRGEVVYWGAGVKMGKSELVNVLAEHTIVEHDMPCFIVKPEEALARSYKMLVSKAAGKIFHDPKIEFDQEAWDKYEPMIGDKAIFIDVYQFVDWDVLKEDIRYAVVGEGVHDIIIDPITAFTSNMSSSEANEFLIGMTAELASMAKDLQFSADIFCHLKAPTQGEAHERGGHVLSTQFAGSRSMMRSCHYMFGLEGNKDPDIPIEERNLRDLILLEDREFGEVGRVPLYWDWHTALFNEVVQRG